MSGRSRQRPLQVVTEDGKPSAVILSIQDYRRLLERAEDLEDLQTLERMRKRPLKFRTLEEFLAEYSPSV